VRFEGLRARNREKNVTRFNVVGPMRRILPGGINSFIHSFIHMKLPKRFIFPMTP
jgi:hypothetical protein